MKPFPAKTNPHKLIFSEIELRIMGKLWQKGSDSLDKTIEQFEVGDDYLLDLKLASFDIYGSMVHATMLHQIGILSAEDTGEILTGLKEILDEVDAGTFSLSIGDEDVHTKVENLLVERIGDAGKRLHTARSRNDQVLIDTRLYTKCQLIQTASDVLDLCQVLFNFACTHEFVPMPGYTHMQLAMPSSIGMWASAFVENLLDELPLLESVYRLNDMNPLGSGASYGVSLGIDRALTTSLLGFARIQRNSLYCGNSRGEVEANVIGVLSSFALILNRIATDLLLFTTKEFAFFKIRPEITTGSSIMPQKKNLDVMELVRARTHVLLGYEQQIKGILASVPSGYNKDYQETKRCLIQSFELIQNMLKVTGIVVNSIEPDEERLIAAHKPEIYATDEAYKLVLEGMPFRDAYRQIGEHLDEIPPQDAVAAIKSKTHVGATGNLDLPAYQTEIDQCKIIWDEKQANFEQVLEDLFETCSQMSH
jgi:argininosuccinate lyase